MSAIRNYLGSGLDFARTLWESRRRRLLLIASHTGRLTGNALGLALAARDSPDFLPVFIGRELALPRRLGITAFGKGGRFARSLWPRAQVIAYTSYYHADFEMGDSSAFRLSLWHGMPIKGIGAFDPLAEDRKTEECDLAIATSDFTADVMTRSFAFPPGRVAVTGEPKTDSLPISGDWNWAASLRTQYRKLVAYIPTWRERVVEVNGRPRLRGDDEAMADLIQRLVTSPRLRAILETNNAAFVLRTHANNRTAANVAPPFFFMSDGQGEAGHLLQAADVVIGDYSSVDIDSLLYPAALGLWCEDLAEYMRVRSFPYFDFRARFGWSMRANLPELIKWLDARLRDVPAEAHELEGARACRSLFHAHEAGGAGRRILDEVKSRLGKAAPSFAQ